MPQAEAEMPCCSRHPLGCYAPIAGRSISEDSLGLDAHPNPFVYVLNNPLNSTDPSGLDATVKYWREVAQRCGHIGIGVNTDDTGGSYREHIQRRQVL